MTRILVGLCCAILVLTACGSNNTTGVFGIDSMRVYMWDMMRADELYLRTLAKDSTASRRKWNVHLYKEVLAIHKISKGQFDSSYNYYASNPILYKLLIDSLDAYASREKTKLYSRYGQGDQKDSVRNH